MGYGWSCSSAYRSLLLDQFGHQFVHERCGLDLQFLHHVRKEWVNRLGHSRQRRRQERFAIHFVLRLAEQHLVQDQNSYILDCVLGINHLNNDLHVQFLNRILVVVNFLWRIGVIHWVTHCKLNHHWTVALQFYLGNCVCITWNWIPRVHDPRRLTDVPLQTHEGDDPNHILDPEWPTVRRDQRRGRHAAHGCW